jgi:hypothetical protein
VIGKGRKGKWEGTLRVLSFARILSVWAWKSGSSPARLGSQTRG